STTPMKTPTSQSGIFNPRVLLAFALCHSAMGNSTAPSSNVVQLFAGGGVGDGAPATSAVLSFPMGLSRTTDGRLLIADSSGRIRSVSGSGITSTIGGPAPGFFPFGVVQRNDGAIWFVQRETSAVGTI